VTPLTLFQAGSISKSLNGVGILTLVQDKKIDLNTDINNYLRSWKFPYDSIAKGKKISMANLLSHTAGLSVHGFPGYARGDSIPSLPQILDGKRPANTGAVRSIFEPGQKFKYSGGGTTISQMVLMDVTGQAYENYMWEHVLRPMGMNNSTYKQPYDSVGTGSFAAGYYEDGKEVKGRYHLYPEQAAAGLWTNPKDLSAYIIETQLSLAGKSNKVLTKGMTELRLTPYVDSSAALGVFISSKGGKKYFSHNGQDEGFTAAYMASFDGNGVVVMSNSNNGALNNEIINSVAAVYNWEGLVPQKRKSITIADSVLVKYLGNYSIAGDTVIISRKDGVIIAGIKGTPVEWKIYFTAPGQFIILEVKGEFSVAKENGNKVESIALKQDGYSNFLTRIE
jgi:CubicO group peptidase (beta-lactamase class C family)